MKNKKLRMKDARLHGDFFQRLANSIKQNNESKINYRQNQ
jgi:hypothetical protein